MPLFKKKSTAERPLPRHIAIVMDGNGRWAKKRGLPRSAGHVSGAKTFKTIARYCNKIGLEYLTVYAFSTENWKRPAEEVEGIMNLLRDYLKDAENFKQENIKVKFIGDPAPLAEDIKELIYRAVNDEKKGMGAYGAVIDDEAADFLSDICGGDARMALNAIELGILTTERAEDGKIHITLEVAEQCIQKRAARYDKDGDNHYDTISAFIKSMRGSDVDATLYYLARMIYAGESVTFIARRIIICASEDVGLADPQALVVANAAAQAVHNIGMPEARIVLAEAAAYVAAAPKSNAAYMGIDAALEYVKNNPSGAIPAHLQDAHYKGAAKLGHGLNYKYAHDYRNHYVSQQYLPDGMEEVKFYNPTVNGYEGKIKEHLEKIRKEAED